MKVKIKGLNKLKKKTTKMLPDARSRWAKEMKASIVDIIVEKIVSGLSPVKGKNQFKKYSEGYAKTKGRQAPVDLVGTGDMLNNMKARQTRNNDIIIEFPDKEQNAKASAHNYGKGKMPKRRLLPTTRETFKSDIMSKIIAALNRAIKESIK